MTETLFLLFTRAGAEWVMALLVLLSVASVAVVIERGVYYARRGATLDDVVPLLLAGRLEEARVRVGNRRGLPAEVARAAIAAAPGGPASVSEAVACAVARSRGGYERGLAFLGTLGNNAPFLGLFGTVVGIVKAFADLAVGTAKGAAASAVMGGISEALVATAVGILVAIPAVVAFNAYQRALRVLVTRAEALGHAVSTWLSRDDVRAEAAARAGVPACPGQRGAA